MQTGYVPWHYLVRLYVTTMSKGKAAGVRLRQKCGTLETRTKIVPNLDHVGVFLVVVVCVSVCVYVSGVCCVCCYCLLSLVWLLLFHHTMYLLCQAGWL